MRTAYDLAPSPSPNSAHDPARRHGDEAAFAVDPLDRTIDLRLLLLPGFDLPDLASVLELVAAYNRCAGAPLIAVRVFGIAEDAVRASCGAVVAVPAAFPSAGPACNLVVLGGEVTEAEQYQPLRFRLARAVRPAARIFSAGGATFALAGAGLIDGRAAAAPWRAIAAWQELHPAVRFKLGGWVRDRGLCSSLGGRDLVGLFLSCIEELCGAAARDRIARDLGLALPRPLDGASAACGDLPPYCEPAVRRASLLLRRNPATRLQIAELCAKAGPVSERTLQRLFRRHLGVTIGQFHRACRLEHARELLRLTPLSIMAVALAAGFDSPTHFSQCYRHRFGHPPRAERRARTRAGS